MKKLVFQQHKGDMRGDLYEIDNTYYYKIYYLVNGRYKLIGQSYANLYDKNLCLERMKNDMEIIDVAKAKRLK